jgi:hypothetical protein
VEHRTSGVQSRMGILYEGSRARERVSAGGRWRGRECEGGWCEVVWRRMCGVGCAE